MTRQKSDLQQQVELDLALTGSRFDSEARRQRIVAGGVQECSEMGYKSVSMASVAKRAGISTATLYVEFKDKIDLFRHCIAYVMPLMARSVAKPIIIQNPYDRIVAMLINHGQTMGDPFMAWLYRFYTNTIAQDNFTELAMLARTGRTYTQMHWCAALSQLEDEGWINSSSHLTTINLLLGQIERRTVQALLLFGEDDAAEPTLHEAAHHAAAGLFANLGTRAFFAKFNTLKVSVSLAA